MQCDQKRLKEKAAQLRLHLAEASRLRKELEKTGFTVEVWYDGKHDYFANVFKDTKVEF